MVVSAPRYFVTCQHVCVFRLFTRTGNLILACSGANLGQDVSLLPRVSHHKSLYTDRGRLFSSSGLGLVRLLATLFLRGCLAL